MIQNNLMDLSSITFNAGMRIVDSIFIESTFYLFIQIEKTLEENGRLVVYKKSDEGFIKDLEFELEEDIYLSNMIVHDDLFIFKSSSRRVVDGSSKVKPLFILKYLNRTFERKIFDGSTKVYNVGNIFEFNPSKNLFVLNSLANPIVGNDSENVNKLIVYEYRDNRFSEKFVWSGDGNQVGEALRAGIKKASFIDNNTFVYIDIQGIKKIVIGNNSCTISVPELGFNISDDTNNHIYNYRNKFIIIADDIIVFDNKFKKLYNKSLGKGEYIVRGDYLLRLNISESDKGKITVYTITDSDIVEKDSFTISGYLTTDRFNISDIFSISNDNKTILVSFNNKYKIPVLNKRLDDLFPIERPRTEVSYKGRFKNITENPPEEELKSKLFYVKGKIELPDPDNPSEEIEDKGEKITGTVTIKGANKTILVSRTKRAYSIRFRITPSDAIIEILAKNKILSGKKTYTVFPGEYQFSIKKEGYKPINGTIEVTNKNVIIEETMELIEQEQPQPPNQGENPPPTPPEESPGNTPPKPPDPPKPKPPKPPEEDKFIVALSLEGIVSMYYHTYKVSFKSKNNFEVLKASNDYIGGLDKYLKCDVSDKLFIIKDLPKGRYKYKVEFSYNSNKVGRYDQFEPDLPLEGEIDVSKESPNYKQDFYSWKNIVFSSIQIPLAGPLVKINGNIPEGDVRMSMYNYLVNPSEDYPMYTDLYVSENFGYRLPFRDRVTFNANKGYYLEFYHKDKVPSFNKLIMRGTVSSIRVNFKDPDYIYNNNIEQSQYYVNKPRVDAIGRDNSLLLGIDGKGRFGYYQLNGNTFNFIKTSVVSAKNERNTYEYDCHKVMMNHTMDGAFVYDENGNINIFKLEGNRVSPVTMIRCNDGGEKIRHYASSLDGSTMVFTTSDYNNDCKGVYILRKQSGTFILMNSYKKGESRFNHYTFLEPSPDGRILTPARGKDGILVLSGNSYTIGTVTGEPISNNTHLICMGEVLVKYGYETTVGVYRYTLSGTTINIGSGIYDFSNPGGTNSTVRGHIINNDTVLLVYTSIYGDLIKINGSSARRIPFDLQGIPDPSRNKMKSYTGPLSKYGHLHNIVLEPGNISVGGNKIATRRMMAIDYGIEAAIFSHTNRDIWVNIGPDNCPQGLNPYLPEKATVIISYDGRFMILGNILYKFENDTTLSCCGIIGLESEE